MWISNRQSLPKDVDRKLKAEYAAESNSNPRYFSFQAKTSSYIGCVGKCVYMADEITPAGVCACCIVGANAQRGWWLHVKGQMLENDRDVVTMR